MSSGFGKGYRISKEKIFGSSQRRGDEPRWQRLHCQWHQRTKQPNSSSPQRDSCEGLQRAKVETPLTPAAGSKRAGRGASALSTFSYCLEPRCLSLQALCLLVLPACSVCFFCLLVPSACSICLFYLLVLLSASSVNLPESIPLLLIHLIFHKY